MPRENNDWLNGVMEFDHVIEVRPDSTVNEHPEPHVYAPESVCFTRHDGQIMKDDEDAWAESLRRQGWEPERGWTGQYGYHGAHMHPSEYVGGTLADYVLETPGLWVVVVVECLRGDPDDAGDDFDETAHTCEDCADDSPNENMEPAGWAILHRELPATGEAGR